VGIDCAQLFVRGKLVRLFTVFVSGIEGRVRLLIDAVSQLSRDHHEYWTCRGYLYVHVQQMKSALNASTCSCK
jgi:hypothetical protein